MQLVIQFQTFYNKINMLTKKYNQRSKKNPKFAKKCISKLRKCSKKELKFIHMYDTKKVASFCSNKDPVPVNLQSHVIYQFECSGCKAQYIGKTCSRCLELRLNEHSGFRTSAVGRHLYECEHFHHIVKLFNISV